MSTARPLRASLWLALLIAHTGGAWAVAPDMAAYDAAIRQARDGKYESALAMLRQMDTGGPGSGRFTRDHIRVAGWAGHSSETAAACARLPEPTERWPADILGACARAYREESDWDRALGLYRQGTARFPERPEFAVGEAMTLSAMGMPQAALDLAKRHPQWIDATTQRRLEGDRLAQLARLAEAPGRGEQERYRIADQALARYDDLIARWSALGAAASLDVLRLRLDRLQVLAVRRRHTAIIAEYEALRQAGIEVPPYALHIVADAYLASRQPEQALQALDTAQTADPARGSLGKGPSSQVRVYALSESGHPGEADTRARQALEEEPIWIYLAGQPKRQANDERTATELAALSALRESGGEAHARAQLEALQARAPADTSLGIALAELYRGQGEPRRAEWLLKRMETLEPRAPALEAAQARVALDLQEWDQARALIEDLRARAPDEPSSRLAARAWEQHRMSELRIGADADFSSTTGPVGGNGVRIDALQYSPPLSDGPWRAFAGGGFAEASFAEGRGEHRWLLAGAQSRSRGLTLDLEASMHRYGQGTRYGAAVRADVDIDDHWSLGASLERLSQDTPLRALRNGVDADRAATRIQWRGEGGQIWRLSTAAMHFSDGNQRWDLALSGRQRAFESARWRGELGLDLAASMNSKEDAPYFNPRRDFEWLPSLRLTHTIYQRYEARLEQTFLLGAGAYTQQGYGSAAIGVLGYGLRWKASDTFEAGIQASVSSRPYDGERETGFRVLLDMSLRF
ncbi:poly-beta-1,6 N-acetyl-D-glucosamine export porin PgaA [Castellaniella sp. GW247-6E4]|uniref:poly-beta-1,6 N-acetyl-D-glucosamine export porin PgaA n=1 Tax=Castellaniella sp. GW247-6E4 TaxID=3140380 RepID=UPI00331583FB